MTMTMPSPRFLRLVLPRWIRFWGVSRSKRIIQKPISTPLRVLPQVLTHWIQVKHARQILNLRLHPLPALYAKKSQRDKLESSQEQNYIFGQLDWGDTLMSQVDFLGGAFPSMSLSPECTSLHVRGVPSHFSRFQIHDHSIEKYMFNVSLAIC